MQTKNISRNILRKRRHKRVRGKVFGTAQKPRLSIFYSLRYVYAEIIDDGNNRVLAQANSKEFKKDELGKGKIGKAKLVGKTVAERSLKKGVEKVVFDRGGYAYHGKVKALADAAREAGLRF